MKDELVLKAVMAALIMGSGRFSPMESVNQAEFLLRLIEDRDAQTNNQETRDELYSVPRKL